MWAYELINPIMQWMLMDQDRWAMFCIALILVAGAAVYPFLQSALGDP